MTPAEIKKLISQLLEPFSWRDVAQVQQRVELMQDAADVLAAQQGQLDAALTAVRDAWNIIEGDTETTEGWAERNASIIAVAQRKEKS